MSWGILMHRQYQLSVHAPHGPPSPAAGDVHAMPDVYTNRIAYPFPVYSDALRAMAGAQQGSTGTGSAPPLGVPGAVFVASDSPNATLFIKQVRACCCLCALPWQLDPTGTPSVLTVACPLRRASFPPPTSPHTSVPTATRTPPLTPPATPPTAAGASPRTMGPRSPCPAHNRSRRLAEVCHAARVAHRGRCVRSHACERRP